MTFAQRRSRLTTHFLERAPVVKRRITVLASLCISVRMEQLGSSHWTDFNEIWHFGNFFEKSLEKNNFSSNLTRITGTLHEHIFTFMIISR